MYYLENKDKFTEIDASSPMEAAVEAFRTILDSKGYKGKSSLFKEDAGGSHYFLAQFNHTRGKITVVYDG